MRGRNRGRVPGTPVAGRWRSDAWMRFMPVRRLEFRNHGEINLWTSEERTERDI
jgi:hypothetical protein